MKKFLPYIIAIILIVIIVSVYIAQKKKTATGSSVYDGQWIRGVRGILYYVENGQKTHWSNVGGSPNIDMEWENATLLLDSDIAAIPEI